MSRFGKKGFTLIELMIVMSIIAVLALLGGANYISSLRRSRDSRRMADLEQVRAALEMYRTDNSSYPNHVGASAYDDMYLDLNPNSGTKYLKSKPVDPGSNAYEYWSNGIDYELCATLEGNVAGPACGNGLSGNYTVENP